MPVFDVFAKRQRRAATAGQPDLYTYAPVPPFLRRQMAMLMDAALGPWWVPASYSMHEPKHGNDHWSTIANALEREIETFPGYAVRGSDQERVLKFIANEQNVDNWLSAIELFGLLLVKVKERGASAVAIECGATQNANSALTELNIRFRESGFGYQFENEEIIRVDDRFVHAEVVKPVLALLAQPGFEKANEDFMTAHRHYRAGENKDAIVAANRSFESTLKAICEKKRWPYDKNARASDLITVVRNAGLFPSHLDNGLDTYVAMLKTGLPGLRNNAGGHGEAPGAASVPDYFAAYAIHLTASNILLAINAAS